MAVHFREGEKGILHQTQTISLNLFSPFLSFFSKLGTTTQRFFEGLFYFKKIQRENERLKKEIAFLKKKNLELKEMEAENVRLKKLLKFKEKTSYQVIFGSVIGSSLGEGEETVLIGRGFKDGVRKNFPVVVNEGLVGQIVSVSRDASVVRLIIDVKSGIGAQIVETRETGLLEGAVGEKLELNFIPKKSKVKKGDSVITSGLGGIFPKGLFIGKVIEVREVPYRLDKKIIVKPEVNFRKLEEVLIIVTNSRR